MSSGFSGQRHICSTILNRSTVLIRTKVLNRCGFKQWRGFLAVALLMFCPWLAAQESGSQASNQLPADVRVVIDVSGSMKQNDPSNLRQPAVELLVQLLPEGSKAGIWTFGRYINMLVPHRPVNDEWKNNATRLSGDINSVGLYTNIGEALEKRPTTLIAPIRIFRPA